MMISRTMAAQDPKSNAKKLDKIDKKDDLSVSQSQIQVEQKEDLDQDPAKKVRFIVRANDIFKFYWDILILLIAILNTFTIPLSLAFYDINTSFSTD